MELTYAAVNVLARGMFRALDLKVEVSGDERVPVSGPVIVASNHVSFLDFALVGLAARGGGRRVRFLARHDLWWVPGVGAAMRAMGHVPVDRAVPAAAYLRARALLRSGEAVGIFPEAGVSTSFTVRALMPGAVALSHETGAPVLPMAIWGPQRILTADRPVDLTRGRPVSMAVGEPWWPTPDGDVRQQTAELGHRLQRLLGGLQSQPQHQPRVGEPASWHPAHLGGGAPDPTTARAAESVPRSAVPPVWVPPAVPDESAA